MNSGNDNLTPLASGSQPGPQAVQHLEPDDLMLYVLELATPEERGIAVEHLGSCEICRAALDAVREDLGEYALAVTPAVEAPVDARARLLAAVEAERPAAPTALIDKATPTETKPEAHQFAVGPSLVPGSPRAGQSGRVPLWLGWGLAAAMALVATHFYQQRQSLAGALGAQSDQIARLTDEQARARAIVDALTDRSAQRVTLNLTKGAAPPQPTGRATYLAGKGTLIFLASHLTALPAGKTYELWVIPANGTAPVPAGTFHPDATGSANVVTESLQAGLQAKAFGITIEPEGGSATPTMPIVLAGS